jgi:type IV pilus assembly protein PilM
MARKVIGLDVGTHAVRAAELSFGRGLPTLERFGQVSLPFGAVVGGEVVDAPAVSAALRRLWKEVGFSSKKVVVGVANQRVVARTADLPSLPEAELRTALQYQVQELIPIPMAEAVTDYQIIERITDGRGQETLRLLVVAAHRDMLRSLLGALEGAGLAASRVDMVPFALIRSIHVPGFELGDEDGRPVAEAIVGVGAGVTNVVVHEAGIPRFVRTLNTGGNAVVDQLAGELGVDLDTAEDLKRRADPHSTHPGEAQAGNVVADSVTHLLEDIRGSLDFHLAQVDAAPLSRIVLTGGASQVRDLAPRLSSLIGVPVVLGEPLRAVEVGSTGIAPEVLRAAEPLIAVPVGLALSGEGLDGGSRRISLLPAEITEARMVQRQLVGAGAGVAGFAAILMALFLVRGGQVDDAETAAAAEEDRTTALEAEIDGLADIEALQADLASRTTTVTGLLATDVAWTRMLQEVATVIPNDVWLESFTGTAGTATTAGSVTFTNKGTDHTSTARWLLRLAEVDSFTGMWVPSSTKTPEDTNPQSVSFTADAALTPAAVSERAATYLEDRS